MPDTSTLPPSLEAFLDSMIEEVHGADVLPAFASDIKEDLRPLLIRKLTMAQYESLTEVDKQGFLKLVEQDADDETVKVYIDEHLANKEMVMAEALIDFRKTYVSREVHP